MDTNEGQKTSSTLVQRLRDTTDTDAWRRFWREFEPLIRRWARRMKLQPADEDDILSEILVKLLQKMPEFEYDPGKGGYHGWVFRVAHHVILDYREKQARVRGVGGTTNVRIVHSQADPMTESLVDDLCGELELLHAAEEIVRREVDELSFSIYVRTLYENQKPAAVAREFDIRTKKVYNTVFRIRRRICETANSLRSR